jgi:hypothetical protein
MQGKLHKQPQGRKTHEQQLRMLERKSDVPEARRTEAELGRGGPSDTGHPPRRSARESEFPVSRGGINQESRDHNKHNNPGQSGHKPQKHGPAEEKH